MFRKLANARIDFYRHLQRLSDDVMPPQLQDDDVSLKISALEHDIGKQEFTLATQIGRSRYLASLKPSEVSEKRGGLLADTECLIVNLHL